MAEDCNEYFLVERSDEPLLTFLEPSGEVLLRLSEFITALPIVRDRGNSLSGFDKQSPTSEGSITQIIAALEMILASDYASNLDECKEWNGSFEYRVYDSTDSLGGIEIHTRLLFDEKPGSVSYGRLVRKMGDDIFVLWADD